MIIQLHSELKEKVQSVSLLCITSFHLSLIVPHVLNLKKKKKSLPKRVQKWIPVITESEQSKWISCCVTNSCTYWHIRHTVRVTFYHLLQNCKKRESDSVLSRRLNEHFFFSLLTLICSHLEAIERKDRFKGITLFLNRTGTLHCLCNRADDTLPSVALNVHLQKSVCPAEWMNATHS